jgi:hypothetical protein
MQNKLTIRGTYFRQLLQKVRVFCKEARAQLLRGLAILRTWLQPSDERLQLEAALDIEFSINTVAAGGIQQPCHCLLLRCCTAIAAKETKHTQSWDPVCSDGDCVHTNLYTEASLPIVNSTVSHAHGIQALCKAALHCLQRTHSGTSPYQSV